MALGHPQQGVGVQGTKGPWFLWHPKGFSSAAQARGTPLGANTVARGSWGGPWPPRNLGILLVIC